MGRSLILGAMLCAVLAAAGCGNQAPTPEPTGSKPAPAVSGSPADLEAKPGPESAAKEPEAAKPSPGEPGKVPPKLPGSDIVIPKQNFEIRPAGSGNWKPPAAPAAAMSVGALGDRIDQAMASLSNALVDGRITFEAEEGQLIGKAELKIESPEKFRLEYTLPELQGSKGLIVADGARRARSGENGWEQLDPAGGSISAEQVASWAREFPEVMLSGLSRRQQVWGPLFRAWSQDKSAQTTLETQKTTTNGKAVTMYRVVSTGPDGSNEVVVDGADMLPVTVRSRKKRAGKEDKMMWTGRWAFGGKHDPKSFVLPSPLR